MIKIFLVTILIVITVTVDARFPRSLQPKWAYLDSNEFSRSKIGDSPIAGVVGGQDADLAEAPFQISLLKDYLIMKSHMCGGSLISESTVVTAAHCTYGQKASSLSVRYGTNQRTSSSYGDLKVKTIIQHESYDPDTIQNDISLLILSKPVVPSTNVQMIEIETDDIVDGDKVTIYGWGLTDGNGKDLPDKLQKGSMTIVGNDRCNEKWGSIDAIHPGMICALDKTQSGCNGDSGGPLVSANRKLTGIVSWGPSKCPPGEYMSVFTRPKYYLDWITKNIV
uniref:Der f 6 allergen n=1 Tax=Dermatophagoides farinae TaxID=6954 RepID=B7U5T1_DERFA|nr:Der f 6 allergen [Dermatophagoides farinae]